MGNMAKNIELNKKNILTIFSWLNVNLHEVDITVQDIAALKKLLEILPDSKEKEMYAYQFWLKINEFNKQ